ncbi:hypothetical protein [Streptomyces sp. NPDC057418]|uniref:hypothetical protein n=1 Tax=unclassified Streptomyces TaxID=2593676 RepID=UPI0036B2ECC1
MVGEIIGIRDTWLDALTATVVSGATHPVALTSTAGMCGARHPGQAVFRERVDGLPEAPIQLHANVEQQFR